ncbi:MAG: hypothetical protein GF307_10865 [candidate division Zixibacteria bacterium]|nr:hypothetical protein [candidate division Zixibacteria bacterium]
MKDIMIETRGQKILRWTARILSIVSITLFAVFLFGEGDFSDIGKLKLTEITGLLFFPGGVIVGMIVSWKTEGPGAAISLGSLAAFYILDIAITGTPPSGPFFVIFSSPAILFAIYALIVRKSRGIKSNEPAY